MNLQTSLTRYGQIEDIVKGLKSGFDTLITALQANDIKAKDLFYVAVGMTHNDFSRKDAFSGFAWFLLLTK